MQLQLGIDIQELDRDNGVTSTDSDWVLSDPGDAYIIYLREGGSTDIDLPGNGEFEVLWMNPRTGDVTEGATLQGGDSQDIGDPPSQSNQDWAVVVYATGG